MLTKVSIKNFKSIRELDFGAKRVNVFIGEPNSGKSNILEALAFSSPEVLATIKDVVRFHETSDLFYDQKISADIAIEIDDWKLTLQFKQPGFVGTYFQCSTPQGNSEIPRTSFQMLHDGSLTTSQFSYPGSKPKYYKFRPSDGFPNGQPGYLRPPFGDNLVAVLLTNEPLRKMVGALFRSKGFRLHLKPTEKEILLTKDLNDELFSYPWGNVSETLRRIVFFMAVFETNENSVLVLDEPEANTFPFYTTYLAERIALNATNQFFLATHNPYVLSSIVGKTPAKDLNVFVTTMDAYETKLKPVGHSGLSRIMDGDLDAFLNLDKLTEE